MPPGSARRSLVLGFGVLLLFGSIPAIASPRVAPVLDSRRNEFDYSTVKGYRSWLESSRREVSYRLYVEPAEGHAYRVPSRSDVGVGSDLALGTALGSVLVFTQLPESRGAQIRIWDLDAGRFVPTPEGVNTRAPEYGAEISGDHILFGRDPHNNGTASHVLVTDVTTGRLRVISHGGYMTADSINGDWATYSACKGRTCDVYRYQVSTGHTRRIPSRDPLYASTVTVDGTVYAVRGVDGAGCGGGVSIVRWSGATRMRTLKRFPNRLDVQNLDALVHGVGVTLFVSRLTCADPLRYDVIRLNA